jgi:hypothetical protein
MAHDPLKPDDSDELIPISRETYIAMRQQEVARLDKDIELGIDRNER